MTGYIIYSDTTGKEFYIQQHIDYFKEMGVELKLVTLDELPFLPLPDFAIMRAISPITSQALEEKGVKVFNNSKLSFLANDKLKSYEFITENGFETMPYFAKKEDFPGIYPCIVKTRDGHGGTEVYWVNNEKELDLRITQNTLIQLPCDTLGKDLRVYVLGGEIKAAMLRSSKSDFRSNFCLGGNASVYDLSPEETRYINKIISAISEYTIPDYIGIDFIFHEGKLIFNEIEDVVGSRMLYTYTDIDIVKMYCEYIFKKVCSF